MTTSDTPMVRPVYPPLPVSKCACGADCDKCHGRNSLRADGRALGGAHDPHECLACIDRKSRPF